jgi:hypothetical protein
MSVLFREKGGDGRVCGAFFYGQFGWPDYTLGWYYFLLTKEKQCEIFL